MCRSVVLSVVLCLATVVSWSDPASPMWKPVADEVYLQEFGEKVGTASPVTGLAVFEGTAYGVMDGGLFALSGDRLSPVSGAPQGVVGIWGLGDALWVTTDGAVYRFAGAGWERVFDGAMVDFCIHQGMVHGATRDGIYRFENGVFVDTKPEGGYLSNDSTVIMADGSQVLSDPVEIGPITGIASYSETLYVMHPEGFGLLNGAQFVPDPIDWGVVPSLSLRDVLSHGSRLCFATARGVEVVRGMALTMVDHEDRLPYEDVTCLASGFDGDLWIGTSTGAIRQTGDGFHYFGATHWLPKEGVNAIAVDGHTVYIATDGGLGIIRYEPYTLAKKAEYYQQMMDAYGFKRLGFVHSIDNNPEYGGWIREISDNDGGNSSNYLAAMSFKYAATGDESARQEALDTFKAMIWLESITGDNSGFFARSIWSVKGDKGELATQGSGGLPAKWYKTDDGLWIWKGDTSSDEVNGHMFGVTTFHDLAAKGPEKERAAQHIARISQHIIVEGWVLRDMDGQPTRWGRWDPDYLLAPYGFEARGLNGVEAQTYMWAAYGMTGDQSFLVALHDQLMRFGYHTYSVRAKATFPLDTIVPWDDELLFWCYYPLLKYADDPELRSIYMRSLERSWEVMRMQQMPFYNFVYGAATGNDCEVPEAVAFLREHPMDVTSWRWHNSHRADLAPEPGYVPYAKGTRAISPRETQVKMGAWSTIDYDGGSDGTHMTPPSAWLQDYWMGRYYGFIEAPTVKDKDLTTLAPGSVKRGFAQPYDGPPRPEGLFPVE